MYNTAVCTPRSMRSDRRDTIYVLSTVCHMAAAAVDNNSIFIKCIVFIRTNMCVYQGMSTNRKILNAQDACAGRTDSNETREIKTAKSETQEAERQRRVQVFWRKQK